MPYAELSTGATLHYEDEGNGQPLILVHGLLGTARINFARVMDWLRPDTRLIGPSLRGYGESRPRPRTFPPGFYRRDADDLLAFMDTLKLTKVHILGYSDGGEVALLAAGLQPERFVSVATIGAVGSFEPDVRPRVQRLFPGTWITAEEKALHGIENADHFILGWVKAFHHIIDTGGDVSLSLAQDITCPVLMMLGDQDMLNPARFAQKFIDRAANARLELFACGHGVHEEAWDDFQRVYGDFLSSIV